MRYRTLILVAAALGLAGLAGCTDIKRGLGMEKVIPDEFAVVTRAPLAIPPDYTLRPPRFGAAPTQEATPTDQARQTVFRAPGEQPSPPQAAVQRSVGEGELLQKAGATDTTGDIRQLVDNDAKSGTPVDTGFVDKLMFWRSPDTAPTNQVIDPQLEAERLKQAKAGGQNQKAAQNTVPQAVPTIERKTNSSSGFFGSILNSIF